MLQRRAALRCALTLSALALPGLARAQAGWPERPLRFVIGGSAGGVSDILVRILEGRLREKLGQPLVLDPRPGAGGMVGAENVARSPGDGYNFYINHIASHGIGPTLYKRLSFDPLKDLPGVARLAAMPNVLIVKGDSPHRSVKELVAYIRANPEKATFSSAGTGTSSHLSGVLFGLRIGVETTHVPYRGTAPSMSAVMNGEVLFAIDNAPASRQQVLAGMLRALAVSTAQRAATMPELPSLQEEGVPDFDVASWYGITAPAATPRPIIERMGAELVSALKDPGFAQRYREFGAEPLPLGPAEYDAFMRAEVAKWAPVVRASGASVE
ncbi:tripartite tricarboxylate transporter substrate binding protein [Siccirubricoccus sp. KC 17139]|uniref:Tripartite tricarboxylate transporter substrate binding protein n=1 Tax=Siccirubricoccus soli TaxID=2899147 RepID=A0ABT1D1L2_9PROT|nr:tripartite tricarboxylate transporter substrate binding protein [Siccirubricoccus soli]MCO6414915.1 tripartite tricarboxylate transporter substrate binding protein [Siccirubricoccus soli]MCP2681045.1 tripartite tricarboxylate transporter substrate binding protein [Siccirubricoccus soli]